MTTINEQAKNIVNEIRNEGNKSKKGQSLEEQFPYPWSDEIDEETDVRNFLISPGENFYFNLNDNLHYAINLLKFDKRLDILRYNIVPKQIKEDEFWKNYFYRISLIKSGQDIKTLPDIFLPEEIPKAEEPEELKKKASEELFSTFVFDKDEEEELLKDFEKEIGGAIHFEDIRYKTPNPANNNVNANPTYEKINTEEFNSGVNGDINSFNAISTKELDSKIEIENDKPNQAAKTNNSATNEAINIITRTDLESEDDLSIVKRHKRALTPYNQFMKQEITKIKAKQPNITHKAAFTEAAQRWKISLNNPKNNSINEAINIISNKDLESEDDLLIVNKPKRALTPYNQFMKQELTKIKAEQPNITHKAAFTEAAQRWKVSLNNPKYNTTDEAINNIGKTNLESEDDLLIVKKPKRALTPYNQFMKQELTKIKAKQPNITHKAAFTEAAQRWKISLNNPKNNTINEVINIISKTDLESVDDLSRVKKHKRALTPYNQFMKQEITKIKAKQPNITHKAAFKEAAQRWIVSLNNSKNNAFDKAINIINKTDLESEDDLSGVKKHKRALTPYNQFLKQELTKIKAEQPNITHKAAFTEAAQRWKVSLNNPKNNSIDEAINNISRTDLESEDDLSRVKRQKRALTPYNQFMKQEITKIKAKQPNITHKAAFKEAAQRWMISLNNPKKNTTNGAINIITKIGLESEDELSRVKKHKRALTPYNQFMKQEITKIKAEQPNITHKAAFTEAAQRWMVSLNNPKNNTTNGAINSITSTGLESEDDLSRVKKPKRALTPYNQFLKQEITKIKAKQPNITHKAAFTEAAQRWMISLNNPKNNSIDKAINMINNTGLESENDLLIVKKQKRALTPYNQFMKQEITKIKAEQPNITHKAAFTEAAQRWMVSLNNPKNNSVNKSINIITNTGLESEDDLLRVKKHKRALTSYNQFMKQELTKIKAEQPNITHKAAFTEAAQRWKVSLNNPKNNSIDEAINNISKTNLESEDDLSRVKKPKRALTPYNHFMNQELQKIKAEQPNITHKAAFTEAAQRWKVSPDNPKNKS